MDLTAISAQVVELATAAEAAAPVAAAAPSLFPIGAGLAMGLAVLGAGLGIGKLAAAALEGSARQPEIQGKLQAMMILAIAFLEALALMAIIFGAFLIKG